MSLHNALWIGDRPVVHVVTVVAATPLIEFITTVGSVR
jgi:hypothetical protein